MGVVIFSNLFLHDPADAKKHEIESILRGSAHACLLKEPELCDLDKM